MRYWRCRACDYVPWLDFLWPLFGHSVRFRDGYAYCERCPWQERLPLFFG